MTKNKQKMEILAPAGSPSVLQAAIETGADAVYLGLNDLNARRGAGNFSPKEFSRAVDKSHEAGVKVYLTLNITLAERELGLAARCVEYADKVGVDAILIADPALLLLKPLYPKLEFHFSTQAAISSEAGMRLAERVGIARAVVARELSLHEIQAASKENSVETEVFVQGALCFCVSGRCLLSSWVGGRSGNRGTCASPCRARWTSSEACMGRFMSMHDLTAAQHLDELCDAGVACLKIEGRLKKAEWVADAVTLFRSTLEVAGTDQKKLNSLGGYTGRQLTDGYLVGERTRLTGVSGRIASEDSVSRECEEDASLSEQKTMTCKSVNLSVEIDEKGGTSWFFTWGDTCKTFQSPSKKIAKKNRALTLFDAAERIKATVPDPWELGEVRLTDAAFLVPKNTANTIADALAKQLRKSMKSSDDRLRISLPHSIEQVFSAKSASRKINRLSLGEKPNMVRIHADALEEVIGSLDADKVVLESASSETIENWQGEKNVQLVAAFPQVFFHDDIPALRRLAEACAESGISLEVNSWDGMELALETGVQFSAGPGLAVLNHAAADCIHRLGAQSVTVSAEADRKKIEDLCAAVSVPLNLCIYGRPALMITRVELDETIVNSGVLEDARKTRVRIFKEGNIFTVRPEFPFSWLDIKNPDINVSHLACDLVCSSNPLNEWKRICRQRPGGLRFNYERTLR